MLTHHIRRTAQMLLIPLSIVFTGCENHNLFSKLHGDSSDPATLNSEAAIALRDKDFSKAVELATRVLANDPTNSEALYYQASAKMGLTGINLATLVSNVLEKTAASGLSNSGFSGLVAASREGSSQSVLGGFCGAVDSILNGVNCDSLNQVIDGVVSNLRTIADGKAHGAISSTDIPLMIDLSILNALAAALTAAYSGYLQFNNDGTHFQIVAGPNLSTLCSHPADVISMATSVSQSYYWFNRVVIRLGLNDSSIVRKLRDDIKEAGDQVFTEGTGQIIPQECFDNVFDTHNPPINQSNYLDVLN
jgi:hypothetical protein